MTREEYEKLLKSDYWKGYSYSLIKERNFTCEDCGRSFPNERNKLQVHHLVYRDVNPWSYRPEEVIVLCEECHKKRHGIDSTPMPEHKVGVSVTGEILFPYQTTERQFTNYYQTKSNSATFGYKYEKGPKGTPNKRNKGLYSAIGIIILILVVSQFGPFAIFKKEHAVANTQVIEERIEPIQEIEQELATQTKTNDNTKPEKSSPQNHISAKENIVLPGPTNAVRGIEMTNSVDVPASINLPSFNVANHTDLPSTTTREKTTLEILEERNHADVVKQAQRAGVSTEGTTLDILERINHADVVKQAQRAGVSTEGTTLDILERINHADVVKQAQRAGVSTEGTTLDILERINHADVVKQAQRAGVSTEGTTLEILDRITRKSTEEYTW